MGPIGRLVFRFLIEQTNIIVFHLIQVHGQLANVLGIRQMDWSDVNRLLIIIRLLNLVKANGLNETVTFSLKAIERII